MSMALENLSDVAVFVQTVDSKGLSAAARVLAIPPNTVSRTLSRLETALGARLLARTTRSIRLTDEGRAFYERAIELLRVARRAEEAVADDSGDPSGLVRVAVRTTTVQFGFLPDLLVLLNSYPRLQVQLVVLDDDVDLISHGLDLALRIGSQPDSSLRIKSLGAVHFALAARPSYLDRVGRPKAPEDLAELECVVQQTGTMSAWNLVGPRGKQRSVLVSGRFGSRDVQTQRDAIYSGFGIGLRPTGEIRRAETSGELERVLPHWALQPISVYAVTPPQRPSQRRARTVDAVARLIERAVLRMSEC